MGSRWLRYVRCDTYSDSGMRVKVAENSPKVEKSVASLSRRGWFNLFLGARQVPHHAVTMYYPYYFQSWRVTAPKSLGRTVKVWLITGVNGMNRSTGPADDWPSVEERELGDGEVILPCTSEVEAGDLAREYAEKYVSRRYRPSKWPTIEVERFSLIYVPYYVYAREHQPLHKAALVEGFTGALGRVKDVPEIRAALTDGSVTVGDGKEEWF